MTQTQLMRPFPDQQFAIDKFRKISACLIGDSMGVGKTVTCIGRDFQLREDYPDNSDVPTLIICEKIGLDVWDWHLKQMGVPEDEILIVNPANREPFEEALESLSKWQRGKKMYSPPRYFIVHWDVLRSIPLLTKSVGKNPAITWFHVIADEVHLAKNRNAVRTKHLKHIATEFKTGASGTPADDKPWDIWSILNWLYPKKYRSYWKFFENHVVYIHSSQYRRYLSWIEDGGTTEGFIERDEERGIKGAGYRIPVDIKNVSELHREIRPFYIRRLLTDIAPDMPPKVHVQPPITVPMERKQRREYEQMRDKALALIGASEEGDGGFTLLAPATIAVLTRLQQMALATLTPEWGESVITDWEPSENDPYMPAGIQEAEDFDQFSELDVEWDTPNIVLSKPSPKLDAAMNLITTNEDEPFVVFTHYRGMADLVEEECQRLKIPVSKITGKILSKDERTRRVADFQEGRTRVFVGTIAAAGKTITLTRAHLAIFTDRFWNPSKNEQAEDRLWRRTQMETVRIYDIHSEDSIDQIRMEKIRTKKAMIDALVNPKRS